MYVKLDSGTTLNKDKLEEYIGHLLWEAPETLGVHVMRSKGIFVDSLSNKVYGL